MVDERRGEANALVGPRQPALAHPGLEGLEGPRVVVLAQHLALELRRAAERLLERDDVVLVMARRAARERADAARAELHPEDPAAALQGAAPEASPHAHDPRARVGAALLDDEVDAGVADELGDVGRLAREIPLAGPVGGDEGGEVRRGGVRAGPDAAPALAAGHQPAGSAVAGRSRFYKSGGAGHG
ncbi:MAG: hypothetical protein IPM79_32635 [Polyangiaceae bacterium]|nr:hypothetical protein [Polyangiaceae bacterium]